MVTSLLLHGHESKVVHMLCVIELSRLLLTLEHRAGDTRGRCATGASYISLSHMNVERAVVMTAADFFWKTLRTGSTLCPVQIMVTCVGLARTALELQSLSKAKLCSLYLKLFELVSAKLDSLTLCQILGTSRVHTFMGELTRIEFEIIERLEFNLVPHIEDSQEDFLRCNFVEDFLFKKKCVIFCLHMIEQHSNSNPRLLSECVHNITSLTKVSTNISKVSGNVSTKYCKLDDQLQVLLVEVFILLELSDVII
jgi:hypothetical protein